MTVAVTLTLLRVGVPNKQFIKNAGRPIACREAMRMNTLLLSSITPELIGRYRECPSLDQSGLPALLPQSAVPVRDDVVMASCIQ